MKHLRLLLFFLSACAHAQLPTQAVNPCIKDACFYATTSGTVAASGTLKLTIQQPATGGKQVTYIAAVVQCSGQAFSVDQSQNGTGATTTATARVALIPTISTAGALAFSASNVGAGTTVAPTLLYTAGDPRVIDLSWRTTGLSGIANNYTITMTNTGSASCSGSVSTYWSEKQ